MTEEGEGASALNPCENTDCIIDALATSPALLSWHSVKDIVLTQIAHTMAGYMFHIANLEGPPLILKVSGLWEAIISDSWQRIRTGIFENVRV